MRIIAGKYRGRVIKMPPGIRPMQDKVRKSLFDILKGSIEGVRFLDLFAGSGAVGIEALSRGAKEAVSVEKDLRCIKVIESNLSSLGCPIKNIIGLDACRAIEKLNQMRRKFDIIFLGPPYYQGMAKKTLQTLSDYDILTPKGLLVIQHFKKDDLPDRLGVFNLFRQEQYGDTLLTFYSKGRL